MRLGVWGVELGVLINDTQYVLSATEVEMREKFRFENLEIWQLAIVLADELFDIADQPEEKRLYRFAEQLRGAGLNIPNNIAEGAGSFSSKDFANFLNIASRSLYEVVNIVIVLPRRN